LRTRSTCRSSQAVVVEANFAVEQAQPILLNTTHLDSVDLTQVVEAARAHLMSHDGGGRGEHA
jgi:hypothetical protein